jgi:hypothetical protein
MNLIRIMLSRCGALLRGKKLDKDLDKELRTHVELAIEENLKSGMSEQEARTKALLHFGGLTQIKERYREQRGVAPLIVAHWPMDIAAALMTVIY